MEMKMHEHDEHAHHGKAQETSVEETELRAWRRKLIGAWVFVMPLAVLMYGQDLFPQLFFSDRLTHYFVLALAFPVIFVIGFDTLRGGLRGFYTFYFNMDSLIALGTVVAYLTGFLHIFFDFQDYAGISAMIMAIFITGKFVETKAKGRATQEIRKLLELGAKKARVLRGKKEIEIDASEIKIGDVMIIKAGEKIPTDGIVVKGESAVDESMVTGESMPVEKIKGASVIGATINQDGILYVRATKIGKDTFLAHIISLVEEAQSTKVPIQKLADKITAIFVPVVLVVTILTFLNWWFLFGDLSRAMGVAISVLVIACPCSLGLAVPIALTVGSGMGAKRGILIRKGEAIQTMKNVKTIVFDKTGTLTQGKPKVTNVHSLVKENYLLEVSASVEKLSEHPVARAIVEYSGLKKFKSVSGFKVLRGKGVEASVSGKKVVIGTRLLMKEKKINFDSVEKIVSGFEIGGKTTMIVAEAGKVIGVIAVADGVKEDSVLAVSDLKARGYRIVMLTGDNENTASAISSQLGITEVIANVLPEDKAKEIVELQKSGMVAFVGDGINDAPALKQSNVGIAMGSGTEIAIEAGDIVLVQGNLKGVVQAIDLSKATFRKIKQNLFWAFAYNVVAIPIAIAGLLNPIIAEAAMALSSLTVITNANLLRSVKV